MDLADKHVIVLGLGKSGIAAVRLCAGRGARVTATDAQPLEKLASEVRSLPATIVCGGHQGVDFSAADLVVVSPGVPAIVELSAAERAGVEVIGELELAWRFVRSPAIAIGGTNGKSTTTTLVGKMLEQAGKKTFVGGNLGTPLSSVVDESWEVLVLEVSSFQLERAPSFRPHVSILLNVTEDHLDRYASFADYARAKGNAFVNQREDDVAIVPEGDAVCLEEARRGHARIVSFGSGGDFDVQGRTIVERASGRAYSLEKTRLFGRHNFDNAAAAIAAARALAAPADAVAQALESFEPLAHRMARVAVVSGIPFYDDSKGTNVGAAVTALRGLEEDRAVLIAGGRDKHGSYAPLVEALEQKGRALVLIGEAADRIASAVGDRLPIARAANMDEAVARALEAARPGDAVLLSPACASFDMFQSYADRGDRFADAARRLEASQ